MSFWGGQVSNINDIISGAFSTLACVAGVDVTYHRASQWIKVRGIPGQTAFALDDGFDVTHEYRSRDYTFKVCDLYFGDDAIEPQRGDLIKETVGDKQHVYEVLRDGSEQVWRHADHGRTAIRVHTKLKEVVDR